MMDAMVLSKVFSVAVAVTVQAEPTLTSAMSYSSTRMLTFMWVKSAIWIRLVPEVTSSSAETYTWFTLPSKSAVRVSPLARRISLAPLVTVSPSDT